MGRTKGSYTLEHGLGPHYKEKTLKLMRKYHFSLNYDESSIKLHKTQQIDVNVSVQNDENRIQKIHYETIKVDEGTSGEELWGKISWSLSKDNVPYIQNMVSGQTDGCAAMLGKFKGCHTLSKKEVTTLPDFGGCEAHDACNIIKHGVQKMDPKLTTLYKCIHSNLEKHSLHKNQQLKDVFDEIGKVFKHVPKILDVRFRYVLKLAEYMDKNDRALYLYYTQLREKGKQKEIKLSETEKMIQELYLDNYIKVLLTNKFLVAVCKPFIQFIDFFESREIRVKREKMMLPLSEHLGLFLKDGGTAG